MRDVVNIILIIFSATIAIVAIGLITPDYILNMGFPLDDAWIHSVYGREIARNFTLAYNPGEPSTGATSPLWALFLAIPHLIFKSKIAAIVLFTKFMGFVFHIISAVLIYKSLNLLKSISYTQALAGAILVAIHPDLVVAAISGMEVSLTSMIMGFWLYYTLKEKPVVIFIASACAFMARPETAVLTLAVPFLMGLRFGKKKKLSFVKWWVMLASGSGALLAIALLSIRNIQVSSMPLPATFYAKVLVSNTKNITRLMSIINGIPDFFKHLAVLDAVMIMVLLALFSVFVTIKMFISQKSPRLNIIFLSGFLWCFVSFFLMPFSFGNIFYHQRYILTGVFFILGALPGIFTNAVKAMAIKNAAASKTLIVAATALVALSIALDYPTRMRRLANDTKNIDDVQVKEGLYLSKIKDTDVIWIVDAGATRFFGKGTYVDMMGLNTYELLTSQKKKYLKDHPPRYIQIVPGWNNIKATVKPDTNMQKNSPTTPYTVTTFEPMQTHYLLKCDRDKISPGKIINSYNVEFPFECATSK